MGDAAVSRGFGFLTVKHKSTFKQILALKQHSIKGRIVDVNFAIDKHTRVIQPEVLEKIERRVYVGNLHPDTTEQQLRLYFAQFGVVVKGYLIYDPISGQSKSRCCFY